MYTSPTLTWNLSVFPKLLLFLSLSCPNILLKLFWSFSKEKNQLFYASYFKTWYMLIARCRNLGYQVPDWGEHPRVSFWSQRLIIALKIFTNLDSTWSETNFASKADKWPTEYNSFKYESQAEELDKKNFILNSEKNLITLRFLYLCKYFSVKFWQMYNLNLKKLFEILQVFWSKELVIATISITGVSVYQTGFQIFCFITVVEVCWSLAK